MFCKAPLRTSWALPYYHFTQPKQPTTNLSHPANPAILPIQPPRQLSEYLPDNQGLDKASYKAGLQNFENLEVWSESLELT